MVLLLDFRGDFGYCLAEGHVSTYVGLSCYGANEVCAASRRLMLICFAATRVLKFFTSSKKDIAHCAFRAVLCKKLCDA